MSNSEENTVENHPSTPLRLEVDKEADAAYLSLREGKVRRTVEVAPDVMADIDASGKVLGLEIIGLKIVDITGS